MTVPPITMHMPAISSAVMRFSLRFLLSVTLLFTPSELALYRLILLCNLNTALFYEYYIGIKYDIWRMKCYNTRANAPVVKLADTPDLGSGAVRCAGSSPVRRTIYQMKSRQMIDSTYTLIAKI